MSFVIHHGWHHAAADDFSSAREAAQGMLKLEANGARYLQSVDGSGREHNAKELAYAADEEGNSQ